MSGSGERSLRVANCSMAERLYMRMPEVGSLMRAPVVRRMNVEMRSEPSILNERGLLDVTNRDPITTSAPVLSI